jgi:GAF domain-containing protein
MGELSPGGRRSEAMRAVAETIRNGGDYRWVGIYEVTETEIAALAWTGSEAPAHPRFPVSRGLCGAAVAARATVVVGDVRNDPRYLTTFGSTRSEVVVPILGPGGEALGLVDVESERQDAFGEKDLRFLEGCASALAQVLGRDL